jgi:hypothetical protein
MAKYFSFYVTTYSNTNNIYSVYYDEINESNYAKQAYTNILVKNYIFDGLAELPCLMLTVEVPDSATSIIVKGFETKTFPLVSTPPTVGTLFLTFDTL